VPKRTSPSCIEDFDDLNAMDSVVVDKRLANRSRAKRGRRNRHYERQILHHSVIRLDHKLLAKDDQILIPFA